MDKRDEIKKVQIVLALLQMSKEGVRNEDLLRLVSNNFSPEVIQNLIDSLTSEEELEVNLKVIPVLNKVGENGINLDYTGLWKNFYKEKSEYLENLKNEISFQNYPGSPGSKSWCLKVVKTSYPEIITLEDIDNDKYENDPIIQKLKRAQAIRKELDLFESLKTKAELNKVHTSFIPYSGLSGRMVSYSPPTQNFPGTWKAYLLPLRKGEKVYELDTRNAEILALAWLTENKEVYKILAQGKDLYIYIASQIFSLEENEVSPLQRKVMKKIVNGITYGMGGKRIAKLLNTSQICKVEVDGNMGNQIKKMFFDLFPNFKDYQIAQTKTKNLETALGHEFEVVPSYKNIAFAPQNLIATLMKKSLIALFERGVIKNVINVVHDSVWVSSDEETVMIIKEVLEENLIELTRGTECEGIELVKITELGGGKNDTTN